jgi:catechol 2,3-dioxygenase-like lactoylglutathione lyase family enzyme
MKDDSAYVRRLAYLSMYVGDVSASRRFYSQLLGLDVIDEGDWGVMLGKADVGLFLHPRTGQPPQHLELTFDVEDVDRAVAALRGEDVIVVDEPSVRGWGDRDGAVADPDGNVIYLRSAPTPGDASSRE